MRRRARTRGIPSLWILCLALAAAASASATDEAPSVASEFVGLVVDGDLESAAALTLPIDASWSSPRQENARTFRAYHSDVLRAVLRDLGAARDPRRIEDAPHHSQWIGWMGEDLEDQKPVISTYAVDFQYLGEGFIQVRTIPGRVWAFAFGMLDSESARARIRDLRTATEDLSPDLRPQ